jgi:hypothetical protein
MANTTIKKGFKPKNIKNADCNEHPVSTSLATRDGDVLYRKSDGLLSGTGSDGPIVGVQNGSIYSKTTGENEDTASAGSVVLVWDNPLEVFVGEITTFTATDPYTTFTTTSCFDSAGSAGATYIDAAASTNDTWRIIKLSTEYDTGKQSAIGAYAKVECMLNPKEHEKTGF